MDEFLVFFGSKVDRVIKRKEKKTQKCPELLAVSLNSCFKWGNHDKGDTHHTPLVTISIHYGRWVRRKTWLFLTLDTANLFWKVPVLLGISPKKKAFNVRGAFCFRVLKSVERGRTINYLHNTFQLDVLHVYKCTRRKKIKKLTPRDHSGLSVSIFFFHVTLHNWNAIGHSRTNAGTHWGGMAVAACPSFCQLFFFF